VIRELAENPNVYQAASGGRRLHRDPRDRFAIWLGPGRDARSATVQRVRLGAGDVPAALAEIRALLRSEGRAGTELELGESCTPVDLVSRLQELGVERDVEEPVAVGMVLRDGLRDTGGAGLEARRVATVEELVLARGIQREAFADARPVDAAETRADFSREGIDGSTFLAWIDGEAVAAAYAAYTPWGLILFGGATLPAARGRGAYRALVAARAADGAARGTPILVTHAGRMSRPILERLGFEALARIDRLVDEL